MTPREQDPAVWAAAFGAAFAGQAAEVHRAGLWGEDLARLVSVARCIEVADAAVRALHPKVPR